MIFRAIPIALAAIPITASGASETTPKTLVELYSGFTLIDPQARKRKENAWLIVRDGRIDRIGSGEIPKGRFAAVHDMNGLYGMPGLIDAHAHITTGPFATKIDKGAVSVAMLSGDKYSRFNAAIALAFGITTIRNPGGSTEAAARYDGMIARREWIGPTARHAGSVIEPPPMAGESFAYPKTSQAWDAEASRQAKAGMTYFKLYQSLTEDEITQGVVAARAHHLIPIAHLNKVSWTRAVNLGVRQLEHALPTSAELLEPEARSQYMIDPSARYMYRWFELADFQSPLILQMIEMLRKKRTIVDLTLVANEITYNAKDESDIFPGFEHCYYQPEAFASAMANYKALAQIWTLEDAQRAKVVWPKVLRFAKLMHDSGVPLMIGTDGTGGGPLYARELGHHVAAGISPWEVLRMATSGNATLMGLRNTGRIARGMEADLIFLRADPVQDVRNVRQVELVVTDGQVHSFKELVVLARSLVQ